MTHKMRVKNTTARKDKGKCLEALTKYCPHCKRTLLTTAFHKTSDWAKRKRFSPWCKECKSKYQKDYAKTGRGRNQYLMRTYGITDADYQKLCNLQGGRCVICGRQENDNNWGRLVVDHNHTTGQIRGLLCNRCNTILGLCNEDKHIFKNMITYLETYNGQETEKMGASSTSG